MATKKRTSKTTSKSAAKSKVSAKKPKAASSRSADARGSAKVSKKKQTGAASKKKTVGKVAKKPAASGAAKKQSAAAPGKKSKAEASAKSKAKSPETKGAKAPVKAPAPKQPKPKAAATKPTPQAPAAADKKAPRKGITIVSKKSGGRGRAPQAPTLLMPSAGVPSLASVFDKPLIPSGPRTDATSATAGNSTTAAAKKSPFGKRDLEKFRKILLAKRQELLGEVADIETEALGGSGGAAQPSTANMDDQGSEDAERSVSLDLVANERRTLREIEEALHRIDNGTYGICELTGRAIRRERLEAVPWTRYSIDAAREIERRPLRS